jgi:4-amino-4-deoxy-L-arabinose transferase-like glycosyltransferase
MTTDLEQAGGPTTRARRGRSTARAARAIAVAAVVLHILLTWFSRPPGLLTGQDDAEYMILARSLRAGGYEELHRVDTPVHSTYPPAYPALLAVWGTITGDGFDALVVLTIALSAATLLLLRRVLLRRGFDESVATGSVVVLAVNPALVAFAGSVMSETPYIFLTVVCLLLLADARPATRRLVLAGAAAILAALTRSIGVTLVVALGVNWLTERRWKTAAALALASALTVGAWLLWTVLAPEQYLGTSYVADLRTGATGTAWSPGPLLRIPGHVAWYARVAVPWQLGVPTVAGTIVDNVVAVLVLAVLFAFGAWTFVRRWRFAAIYFLTYGGLLALWLWRVDRFVVPLLPLIVPALLAGAYALGDRFGLRRPALLAAACALLLALGAGARTAADVADATRCDRALSLPDPQCLTPDRASFFDAIRWIGGNTAGDDVLLAAKAAPLYLYTGRRSVGYGAALSADATTFLPYLREHGTDYILLGALEQSEVWQLAPLLADVCDRLALRASFPPNTYLFAIPSETALSDSSACAAVAAYLAENGDRMF